MYLVVIIQLLLLALLNVSCQEAVVRQRVALIMTIAGPSKLVDYFEWSCRSIYYSRESFDLLIFHENNQRLRNVSCAENVKFFNLGERGISKLVASKILEGGEKKEEIEQELTLVINNILIHSPKYLVEIKPLLGNLLSSYIKSYTHWSYTDPDIIWGTLPAWISSYDLTNYDILTVGKNWDAARLYLRGQLTIHKNTEVVNNLWKELKYFEHTEYSTRLGTAYRMIVDRVPTDVVFRKNFHSAEGWYSQIVFKKSAILKIKVIGRGFDDFFREPVILSHGILSRCALQSNLTTCIQQVQQHPVNQTIDQLPAPKWTPATAYYDSSKCKMSWLPIETRFCLASADYDKGAALSQNNPSNNIKLLRAGEVMVESGRWFVNDEMVANRQVHETAAYFHFRDWDRYITQRKETVWSTEQPEDHGLSCMVLYLRYDKVLAFENCNSVIQRETLAVSQGRSILLDRVATQFEGHKVELVSKVLSYFRKESEVGEGEMSHGKNAHGKGNSGGSKPRDSQGKQEHHPSPKEGELRKSKQQHMRGRKKHGKKD